MPSFPYFSLTARSRDQPSLFLVVGTREVTPHPELRSKAEPGIGPSLMAPRNICMAGEAGRIDPAPSILAHTSFSSSPTI